MASWADEQSERFARAIEDGVTDPGSDEQLRRELDVVGLLVRAGGQPSLDGETRARMRERIVAALAEADADAAGPAAPAGPVGLAGSGGRADSVGLAGSSGRADSAGVNRGWLLAAAAVTLLVGLVTTSVVLSRGALPGEALYGVKRTVESAELGLTFGDQQRGFKHLRFATERVDEIEALAARAAAPGLAADEDRYLTALHTLDTEAAAGSRLLIEVATTSGGGELPVLGGWAETQRGRLVNAAGVLPAPAAAGAGDSIALLDRVIQRVAAVRAALACGAEVGGWTSDDIGPVPGGTGCPPGGGPGTQPGPGGAQTPSQPGSLPGAPSTATPGGGSGLPGPLDPGPVPGVPPGGEEPTVVDPLPELPPTVTLTVPSLPPVPTLPEVTEILPPLLPDLSGSPAG